MPLFAYRLSKKTEIITLLKSGVSIIFCVSVSLIVCLFAYRLEIMQLLYSTSNVQYSAEVFGYLLLNFFPVAILYVIGTLLTANQNFRLMIYTLVLAVILNISLNFILITRFGAKGAGQATLITQLFMLVSYTIYSIRIFKLKMNVVYVFQLFSFILLCLLVIVLLKNNIFSENQMTDFLMHVAAYFVTIPFIAFSTGLIGKHTFQLKVGASE